MPGSIDGPTTSPSITAEEKAAVVGGDKPPECLGVAANGPVSSAAVIAAEEGTGNDIARPTAGEKGSGKSDSEAETIVLPDVNGNGTPQRARTIKHEEDADPTEQEQTQDLEMTDATMPESQDQDKARDRAGKVSETGKGDLAEKDTAVQDGGNSSGLSSALSSPATGTQQASNQDSVTSDPKQPNVLKIPTRDAAKVASDRLSRKRKAGDRDSGGDEDHHNSGKSDTVEVGGSGSKERRETRSGANRTTSPTSNSVPPGRSPSPRLRVHKKAASQQASTTGPPNGGSQQPHKRRKVPPPLYPSREGRDRDGNQSDSSDSSGSPQSHTNSRRAPNDSSIVSPAKMAPNKRYRDQIGRTLLARACAGDDIGLVKSRLKERPEDLDVADFAGNTPVQIACLEGSVDIVKLLIDNGCDIHCRNYEKDTPLIDAVENGHYDVVKLLLSAGVNPRRGNVNGSEPLDLLKNHLDNADIIRDILLEAKKTSKARRPSEDHSGQATGSNREGGRLSRGMSAHSPRQSPPMTASRSPPPVGLPPRRKTVRSEITRNDLLWMKPNLDNLRDRAGKGDMAAVANILNVLGQADSESLVAAARGGHDEVMQLLLGLGGADADPTPSDTLKSESNTPMLAAIGRGNEKVIQLLLDQPNFNAARLDHRGHTYYEIAKERKGENWSEEYRILKDAYDAYTKEHGLKRSLSSKERSPNSSRTAGKQRDTKRQRNQADSHSPSASSRRKLTESPTRSGESKALKRDRSSKGEVKSSPAGSATKAKKSESRGGDGQDKTSTASEREKSSLGPPNSKSQKQKKSVSEGSHAMAEADSTKPRRKLVSGKVLKGDLEKRRRASVVSAGSSSGPESRDPDSVHAKKISRRASTESQDVKRLAGVRVEAERQREGSKELRPKREESKDRLSAIREASSKRSRKSSSSSPPRSQSQESESHVAGAAETLKKKRRLGHGSGKVAEAASAIDTPRSASKDSKPTHSPDDAATRSTRLHATNDASGKIKVKRAHSTEGHDEHRNGKRTTHERSEGRSSDAEASAARKSKSKEEHRQKRREAQLQKDLLLKEEAERQQQLERERDDQIRREQAEAEERAKEAEQAKKRAEEAKRRAEQEEAERLKAEAEKARLEAEREEAERKARIEREKQEALEKERRRVEEEERQARIAREEEQARQERAKREEEAQRRRAEQELQRQQELERRRIEREKRHQAELEARQLEQERARREALPWTLQRLAEIPAEVARNVDEVKDWMPLYASPLRQIDPDCPAEQAEELWVNNLQTAGVLGVKDLALSQYTAWEKRPVSERHKVLLWRIIRMKLSGRAPMDMPGVGVGARDRLTQAKFRAMDNVFWLKLSDLLDITPRYPHLQSVRISTFTLRDLNRTDPPRPANCTIIMDPEGYGWTVTPYKNGTYESYTPELNRQTASLSPGEALFRPITEIMVRLPERPSITNGVQDH
ncbi:MAG: hypothetical protein M1825_006475 [Sarcosagium campestre]|nr:MAG: hypothetical protein M1825_006475 [Sarcosagium campestre]